MKTATKSDAIVAVVRRCNKCQQVKSIDKYRARHRICRSCSNKQNRERAKEKRRAKGVKPGQPKSKEVRRYMNEDQIAARFAGRRFD